jgi:hypothetical protein
MISCLELQSHSIQAPLISPVDELPDPISITRFGLKYLIMQWSAAAHPKLKQPLWVKNCMASDVAVSGQEHSVPKA